MEKNDINKKIYDPKSFKSVKTGRGPLTEGWIQHSTPIMCAYKLAEVKFQVWGFQTKVENIIFNNQKSILTNFHKQVFCMIDDWYGLTLQDIRRTEEETKEKLDAASGKISSEGFHSEQPKLDASSPDASIDTMSVKSMP